MKIDLHQILIIYLKTLMVPKDENRRVCIACQAYARQCTRAVERALKKSHPGRNLALPRSNHLFLKELVPSPNDFSCLYNENNKPTLQVSSVVRCSVGPGVSGELKTVRTVLCSPRVCHRVRETWPSMQKHN